MISLRTFCFLVLGNLLIVLGNVCPPNADPEFQAPLKQCAAPQTPLSPLDQCPEYQDLAACTSEDSCDIGVLLATEVFPFLQDAACREFFRNRECGYKCNPRQNEFVAVSATNNVTFTLCTTFCYNMWDVCKNAAWTGPGGNSNGTSLVSNVFTPESFCTFSLRPNVKISVITPPQPSAYSSLGCYKGSIDPNPRYSYFTDVRPSLVGDLVGTTFTAVNDLGAPEQVGGYSNEIFGTYTLRNASFPTTVIDQMDGSYVFTYTPTQAGQLRITPLINSTAIFASPFMTYVVNRSFCALQPSIPYSQKPSPPLNLCKFYDENACCDRNFTNNLYSATWYQGILASYGSSQTCIDRFQELVCGATCSPAANYYLNRTDDGSNPSCAPTPTPGPTPASSPTPSGRNTTSTPTTPGGTTAPPCETVIPGIPGAGYYYLCSDFCNLLFSSCSNVYLLSGLTVKDTYGTAAAFCKANNPFQGQYQLVLTNQQPCFSGQALPNVSAALSRIVKAELCLFAGETGAVTIQAVDPYLTDIKTGRANALAPMPFAVQVYGPSAVPPPQLIDNGDGTYSFYYRFTVAGDYNIRITDPSGNVDVSNTPLRIHVNPGPVSASQSLVTNVQLQMNVNETGTFYIQARDAFGNFLDKGGSDFYGTLTGPAFVKVSITDIDCSGKYIGSFTPTVPGVYNLTIWLGPNATIVNTFIINVGNDTNGGGPSSIDSFAYGPGLGPIVYYLEPTYFTIVTIDGFGKPLSGDFNYEVVLTNLNGNRYATAGVGRPETNPTKLTITPAGLGTYRVTYTPTWIGKFLIYIGLNGKNIRNSPYEAESIARNGTGPGDCSNFNYCSGHGQCVNGSCVCFTDAFGIASWSGPNCSVSPAPQWGPIRFTNSGNRITALLNVETNRAGLVGRFDCSKVVAGIFSYGDLTPLGVNPFCTWKNSSNLLVFLGANATVVIGDPMLLNRTKLFSKDGNVQAVQSNGTILRPIIYPMPHPRIVGPTSIPFCYPLELDASTSYGSGSRPLIHNWTLEINPALNPPPDATALKVFLQTQKASIITLPILTPGFTYTFSLTVTNFFGITSDEKILHNVRVGSTRTRGPTVVVSPTLFVAYGGEDLTLSGKVIPSVLTCIAEGLQPFEDTEANYWYSWIQVSGPPFELDTNSANTKDLFIPRYTLITRQTYVFQLRALHKRLNLVRGDALVTVYVYPGPPITVLDGGDARAFTLNPYPLQLDASRSIPLDSPLAPLSFVWNCSKPKSQSNFFAFDAAPEDPCCETISRVLLPEQPFPTVTLPAGNLGFSPTKFTVATRSLDDGAIDVQSTTIVPGGNGLNVQIYISDYSVRKPASPTRKLSLISSLQPANDTAQYEWLVDYDNLNLDDITFVQTRPYDPFLVINPDVLADGEDFSFTLLAKSAERLGYATLKFTSNEAPNGGYCITYPQFGVPNRDIFHIRCEFWEDDLEDQPLQYAFFFSLNGGQRSALSNGRSYDNELDFTLPLGEGQIIAEIYDKSSSFGTFVINTGISTQGSFVVINNFTVDNSFLVMSKRQQGSLTPEQQALQTLATLETAVAALDLNLIGQLIKATYDPINLSTTDDVATRIAIRSRLMQILESDFNLPPTSVSVSWKLDLLSGLTSNPAEINSTTKALGIQLLDDLVHIPLTRNQATFNAYVQSVSNLFAADNFVITKQQAYTLRQTFDYIVPSLLLYKELGEPRHSFSSPNVVVRIDKLPTSDLKQLKTITGESIQFQLGSGIYAQLASDGFEIVSYILLEFKFDVYNYQTNETRPYTVASSVGALTFYDRWGNEIVPSGGPVVVSFLSSVQGKNNASCTWWDYATSKYSDRGCDLFGYTAEVVTCVCNHLTDFAVTTDTNFTGILPILETGSTSRVNQTPLASNEDTSFLTTTQVILICLTGGIGIIIFFIGLALYRRKREKVSRKVRERQLLERHVRDTLRVVNEDMDLDMSLEELIERLKDLLPKESDNDSPRPIPRSLRAHASRLLGLNKAANDSNENIRVGLGTVDDWYQRYPTTSTNRHEAAYSTDDEEDKTSRIVAVPTGIRGAKKISSRTDDLTTSVKTEVPQGEEKGLKVVRKTEHTPAMTTTSRTVMNVEGGSEEESESASGSGSGGRAKSGEEVDDLE